MDSEGQILAQWFLLSNLDKKVSAQRIGQWYYYRWSIESFFKLLKEAGHQLESWGQQSAEAIARRLLLVSQACAYVWQLMRAQGHAAETQRQFLVRLSGRQMKRSAPITATALMDGLYKFLAMSELLATYSLQSFKNSLTSLGGKMCRYLCRKGRT